tara:strand:- start:25334 stop:26722 length:1389 start_codon:yes stop_codon:yes gene_type:complete
MASEKSLLTKFTNHLKKKKLFQSGARGLIAVSGGLDSVVLLDLMLYLSEELNLSIGVAHFNHNLRGEESELDAQFVEKMAHDYGLEFHCAHNIKEKGKGESTEEFARNSRYEFLRQVMEEYNYDWTTTAHHADDQVETVFLRMISGSGVSGLRGIPEVNNKLIRPLLTFTREQIQTYADERELNYRTDSSNDDITIQRNFFRHKIAGLVKELNPGIHKSIKRLTDNLDELEDFMESPVNELMNGIVERTPENLTVPVSKLEAHPMLIQKRLIQKLLGIDLNWRHHTWDNLESFLRKSQTGDFLELPGGVKILRNRDKFILEKSSKKPIKENIQFKINSVEKTFVKVGEFELTLHKKQNFTNFSNDVCRETVNIDSLLNEPLILRLWQPGDNMIPLGMNQFKKVSDILIDRKIDRFQKERQYVLKKGDETVWLCGVVLDNRFRITDKTDSAGELQWNRAGNLL